MTKDSKNLQKSRPSILERVQEMDTANQLHIARKINEAARPESDRKLGRVSNLKALLAFGNTSEIQHVIETAHGDKLADQAVREYIAELIDQGRQQELTSQLRAYAVMCLVYPMQIMRRRDG
jgi:hypothetical protein